MPRCSSLLFPFCDRFAYSCMMKLACGVAAALLALWAGGAGAQTGYPAQTVRILVGFSPGVAPDVTARLLADRLSEAWGKPVVVENVTGAGGNIGALRVAKAAPDGYTLGMIGNGSLVFSPSLYDQLRFDPIRGFAPIPQVLLGPNGLRAPPETPAPTPPEPVALAP